MKKLREISVSIGPTGDISVEGHGFVGTECDAFMKPIEAALAHDKAIDIAYKRDAVATSKAKETEKAVQRW